MIINVKYVNCKTYNINGNWMTLKRFYFLYLIQQFKRWSFLFLFLLVRFLSKLKNDNAITDEFSIWYIAHPDYTDFLRFIKQITPLRPICLSVNSYDYRRTSKLAKIISPHIVNAYTVKNTFSFVDEINNLSGQSSVMSIFDVSSLFTCIPLNETLDIALNYIFKDKDKVAGLCKKEFKKPKKQFFFQCECYDIKLMVSKYMVKI